MRSLPLLIVASWLLGASDVQAEAAPVVLAENGRMRLPVVVAPDANDAVKATAARLAAELERIVGQAPTIEAGDGARGIVVGLIADFPQQASDAKFDVADPTRREDYLLRSHADGLLLLGATDLAVQHAVWDLLGRVGYRQYFPGKHWEIVPSRPDLTVDVDAHEHPSYYSRRIWYGYGAWDYAKVPYAEWCAKNRCLQGIELNTGHAYDGILARNKEAFAAHPEYLGLVKGERRSTKFCISNPALRQLVVDDALRAFDANPAQHSVSVDPSDGGGWCECAECARLGSVTDRAVTLANAVAAGVTAKYPDKFVGMYAYNEHSPPPSIDVHPRVVISVATSFIRGGFTIDQLLDGWSQRASILGIREYYSVNTWDRDLPGAARGGRLNYLTTTIPHFHDKGARFLSAESSDNWGPNGLGYYLAARMMWNVAEAERVDALTDKFFRDCFGDAVQPMKELYALLDGDHRLPLSDDLIGRMYRRLDEAYAATSDEAVRTRIDDLTQYARHCELWLDYSTARDAPRQAAFEQFLRHAYRMRETMLVHSLALFRDVANRDKSVTLPDDAKFNVPEGRNPWKTGAPYTPAELAALRSAGIARRKLLDFTPVSFGDELVPAAPLGLSSGKLGSVGIYSRTLRNYYTWVERQPALISFAARAGTVYMNQGPGRLALFPAAEAEGKSVAEVEVPPTRTDVPIDMATTFTGLHRLEVQKGGGIAVTWPEGVPLTVESSFERPGGFHGRWSLYFYVPRGTPLVGGFGTSVGKILDAEGKVVHEFDGKPGYFSVPVAAGQDGRLWKFDHCAGDKMLMTVPPYLARSAAELLLPREVVERDAK